MRRFFNAGWGLLSTSGGGWEGLFGLSGVDVSPAIRWIAAIRSDQGLFGEFLASAGWGNYDRGSRVYPFFAV